jgi:hypothetical protein
MYSALAVLSFILFFQIIRGSTRLLDHEYTVLHWYILQCCIHAARQYMYSAAQHQQGVILKGAFICSFIQLLLQQSLRVLAQARCESSRHTLHVLWVHMGSLEKGELYRAPKLDLYNNHGTVDASSFEPGRYIFASSYDHAC